MFKRLLLGTIATTFLYASLHTSANAYYDPKDYPEYIEIQSNQSAFAIPVVGDTKSTQAQFGSKSFLDASKVATKRFQIPHTLIRNPGWATDYYVPSVKLILVDRTPYMREWMDATDKGTSTKKQGFVMQSKEGINIGTGIAISSMVKEEDAALFLYTFGTNNDRIDPTNPASNFQSVSYGKSLAEIMDSVVRGYVESALEKEFMKNDFDYDNQHAADIIDAVQKDVKDHFATEGITIDYVGFAGTLDFDPLIQTAINKVYVGKQFALESQAMMPSLDYQRAQADIDVRKAEGAFLTRWDGHLPAMPNWIFGTEWIEKLISYTTSFGSSTASHTADLAGPAQHK